MAKQYLQVKQFLGLSNFLNPRDIGFGLSKAQNVSIDRHGMIRTMGGLADFTKVDGTTALTQTAKLVPGSGLFTYGSDHWRGTDTIVDLAANNNAASDRQTEANATTGWTEVSITLTSDTPANFGIASNSTTYVIRISNVAGPGRQFITTTPGQRYQVSADLYSSASSPGVQIRIWDNSTTNVLVRSEYHLSASWANYTVEFVAIGTTTVLDIYAAGATAYFDDVYFSKVPKRDIDTDWLALLDAANAQIDLYNVNDDSFTDGDDSSGFLDFGTVSSYVATIDKINFPTTNTITDANNEFFNQGIQIGDVRVISGCSTQTANNIMFVVEHVSVGTITARGNPFTVTADEDGTVTLTKYNPTAFHYVNEALRASPIGAGVALRPKHYGFADRIHFSGALSSERKFQNWFLNDVGPVKPTDLEATTSNGDGTATNLTAGAGFEIGITRTADDGEWAEGTYIIAMAFKYDDGQISALFVPSTDEEFGTAILDGDSLTLTIRGKNDYDERISGGYIFCRIDESDDPWSLLAEISMADGARATLSGTYNSWNESDPGGSGAVDVAYTANFKSIKLSLDSYESIAGIDPTTRVEVFTTDNTFWDTSVIGGNRCFIASVRYTDSGGNLQQFRDRIMYSQVNAYDTFAVDNIIDVVRGDAEDYVKLGIYGNDLLCFKQRTLYIIDISDPDPAGWQMKQDKNKGKYPFRGVRHPGAYFETPHGPVWCNEFGVFLYNGEIVELLGDKIERSKFPLAYQRYYEFDGDDDYVTVADSDHLDFGNGDGTIEALISIPDVSESVYVYLRREDGSNLIRILVDGGTALNCTAFIGGVSMQVAITNWVPVANTWYHLAWTFVNGGANAIYIDGVSQTLSADTQTGGNISITADLTPGRIQSTYNQMRLGLLRQFNRALSSSEATGLYNGAPVAAADIGGSQTELLTDADLSNWTTDDLDDWTEIAADTGTESVSEVAAGEFKADAPTGGGGHANIYSESVYQGIFQNISSLVVGKKYRALIDINGVNGGGIRFRDGTNSQWDATYTTAGVKLIEFTATSTSAKVEASREAGGATDDITINKISLVQIGVVMEYHPKGIGDATWTDQSGNSLDGTVNGATAIFEDSWESFYTDYSIVGYQAKTNMAIIMRDCTGKWSSGQDYGDCFMIDLDTGFITTGRRVFTKGIVYSNWETDWNNELIIAEQTSSTSVTIKKWTDEPQSQAAGLIDVRTADFDLGNPMFKKIIDAFVATYKSSAAQTNPISYAKDGDDRQTAWTRLTGNMDAEGYWEKLVIEMTSFNVDSIRFKIDNPTAACIMELNDLGFRYEEVPLKLI